MVFMVFHFDSGAANVLILQDMPVNRSSENVDTETKPQPFTQLLKELNESEPSIDKAALPALKFMYLTASERTSDNLLTPCSMQGLGNQETFNCNPVPYFPFGSERTERYVHMSMEYVSSAK
jgi:hypothetical protein